MNSLEADLDAARDLAVADLADAIESIGFECTRCGGCCTGYAPDEPGGAPAGAGADETGADAAGTDGDEGDAADCHGDDDADREPHTATVFPDEVRRVAAAAEDESGEAYDWRDVARPMPFGLD
ncbi:YkgJ family cysteine cluster protein, partial [Halorubrum sp. SS5]